ncbi:hypothetical protein [Aminobacter carboxidus]|uniref:Uncharacterized protein n=1 Tax=Aminobacter carboxidus TaxID=376165 RepID=A0ABR9GXQ7_9HYPH|nr:hypothetical protein [Aminobacter carboxidus]MBE1208476.1 hypothetical protein [Aminobacter carboxidus]
MKGEYQANAEAWVNNNSLQLNKYQFRIDEISYLIGKIYLTFAIAIVLIIVASSVVNAADNSRNAWISFGSTVSDGKSIIFVDPSDGFGKIKSIDINSGETRVVSAPDKRFRSVQSTDEPGSFIVVENVTANKSRIYKLNTNDYSISYESEYDLNISRAFQIEGVLCFVYSSVTTNKGYYDFKVECSDGAESESIVNSYDYLVSAGDGAIFDNTTSGSAYVMSKERVVGIAKVSLSPSFVFSYNMQNFVVQRDYRSAFVLNDGVLSEYSGKVFDLVKHFNPPKNSRIVYVDDQMMLYGFVKGSNAEMIALDRSGEIIRSFQY